MRLFATAFYAGQDTRTPVRVAVGALALNALLGIALAWLVGTPGIALATALAAIANATALGGLLRRRLGRLWQESVAADTVRMLAAALVAGALAALPYAWLSDRWPDWETAGRLLGAALLYGGIGTAYLAVAGALGVDELGGVRERFAGRRRGAHRK